MRPVQLILGLGLLWLTAGCSSPEPPAVFVDLSQLQDSSVPESPPVDGMTAPALSASVRLEGTSSARLFGALSDEEFAASVSDVKSNQATAVKKILEQRIKVLDAEIESAMSAARAALEPSHQALLDEAVQRARAPFDRIAPQVGRLTLELTNLIGFPDRGQDYRTVDADWSRRREARVAQIRQSLRQLEAEYLAERNAIFAEVDAKIRRDLQSVEANGGIARREGEARLVESLRRLTADSGTNPTRTRISGTERRSGGLAPKSTTVKSDPARLPELNSIPAAAEPGWIAQQKAKIWAATHGYRLVTRREEGRDATQECIAWIRNRKDGP